MEQPQFPDIEISYDSIHIVSASSGAGVFNGVNTQFGWSSHSKTNSAFGTLSGHDNQAPKNINLLDDNDMTDTIINDQDLMVGY